MATIAAEPRDGATSVRSSIGTLTSLIAEHARATPKANAILAPDRAPLTYEALARHIDDVAHALARAGYGRGTRIAIALPNGSEYATALLGVMSCAACVPLDPDSEADTLRDLCLRLHVDAILVMPDRARAFVTIARDVKAALAVVEAPPGDPAGAFSLRFHVTRSQTMHTLAQPDDVALVLHTSGTTGKSKAVPVIHARQLESTLRRNALLALGAADRALCMMPLFNAAGLRRNLFPPLAAGGSVVCAPEFDARAMLDWLGEFSPTYYAATPAVHRAVLEAIEAADAAPAHSLRFIVSASAKLATETHARLEKAFGVPVLETYAMTEVAAIAHSPPPPAMPRSGSVGPAEQGEIAIVGADGRFVDAGESGEIVVRGPDVFPGYENDDDANAQAFIDGWFRTGDLGYLEADGYLHVKGRANEMINRGGRKVSPCEVDAVLARHPDVVDAAAFAIPHPTLGEDLIAAVVLRERSTLSMQQLRDHAFADLAKFKVPTRIVAVPSIPKTPLGKARRRELAELPDIAARPAYLPPRNANETIVAKLFADILGLDAIGCDDNFFSLGGDSLRALQVIARATAHFDCVLDRPALFRRPTVAEFACEIDASIGEGGRVPAPPIVALPRDGVHVSRQPTRKTSVE